MSRRWFAVSSGFLSVGLLSLGLTASGCSGKRSGASPPPPSPPATTTPSLATPTDEPAPVGDPREQALTTIVRRLFEQRHLLRRPVDDEVAREAMITFLDRLDPGKLYLLAADREALAAHGERIDDQLRAGRLDLAHEAAERFRARIAVIEPMVAAMLAGTFDHDDVEEVELDDDKLTAAATDADLRQRWRQRLELELIERTATPDDPKLAKTLPPLAEREAKAKEAMATAYAGRFARLRAYDATDAGADLINAVGGVLDPHTDYLPPADKANFDIRMSGSVQGIGALLRERDHYVEVQELVPGGAAWRQGQLTAGDLILSVANEGGEPVDVVDMRIDEVVKMIRGPKGSKVRLRVRKASGDEATIDLVRDVVVIEAAYARGAILGGKGLAKLGYVYLPSFYRSADRDAAGDVARLVGDLRDRKVAGIILDLRGNGGGLLDSAVDITGLFIDRGPVVQVKDGDGDIDVLADDQAGTAFDGPVVVLVDRWSASASEIVAGALQDYRRAVIVGTGPTHGKGTVQSLESLDRYVGGEHELGSLKLTIQQFYRVGGASTQLDGVMPDVVLPDPQAFIDGGERALPHAIASSTIAAAAHSDWPSTWKLGELAARSAARTAKEPLFAGFAAASALLRERRKVTALPLQRSAYEALRASRRDELAKLTPDLDKAPIRLTVTALEAPPAPAKGERVDDRMTRWRDQLARDPWLTEAARILSELR